MQYEHVKEKFGSWAPYLKDVIETAEFDQIFKSLKALTKRGRTVFPSSEQTFRCFQLTPYQELKAVFVFSSPYETQAGERSFADGLALSASNVNVPPPGLRRFFDKMQQDFGGMDYCLDMGCNLSYLASQGILLLNAALTTEQYKYGSHIDLWRPFMQFLFSEVISRYKKSLPVVFFGEQAQAYDKLVMPFNHWTFTVKDPVKLPDDEEWDHQHVFRQVDSIIRDNNPDTVINWSPFAIAV